MLTYIGHKFNDRADCSEVINKKETVYGTAFLVCREIFENRAGSVVFDRCRRLRATGALHVRRTAAFCHEKSTEFRKPHTYNRINIEERE